MADKKTPAGRAISAFGGVQALSNSTGIPAHRIYRWKQKGEKGGRGGRVPDEAQPTILAAARKLGLALSAEDLIDMRPPTSVPEDVQ